VACFASLRLCAGRRTLRTPAPLLEQLETFFAEKWVRKLTLFRLKSARRAQVAPAFGR